MSTPFIADAGDGQLIVYRDTLTDDDAGQPVLVEHARYPLPDVAGGPDELLRAHGWRRVTRWSSSDDNPAGHQVALVTPVDEPDPALVQLARDQREGDRRRGEPLR